MASSRYVVVPCTIPDSKNSNRIYHLYLYVLDLNKIKVDPFSEEENTNSDTYESCLENLSTLLNNNDVTDEQSTNYGCCLWERDWNSNGMYAYEVNSYAITQNGASFRFSDAYDTSVWRKKKTWNSLPTDTDLKEHFMFYFYNYVVSSDGVTTVDVGYLYKYNSMGVIFPLFGTYFSVAKILNSCLITKYSILDATAELLPFQLYKNGDELVYYKKIDDLDLDDQDDLDLDDQTDIETFTIDGNTYYKYTLYSHGIVPAHLDFSYDCINRKYISNQNWGVCTYHIEETTCREEIYEGDSFSSSDGCKWYASDGNVGINKEVSIDPDLSAFGVNLVIKNDLLDSDQIYEPSSMTCCIVWTTLVDSGEVTFFDFDQNDASTVTIDWQPIYLTSKNNTDGSRKIPLSATVDDINVTFEKDTDYLIEGEYIEDIDITSIEPTKITWGGTNNNVPTVTFKYTIDDTNHTVDPDGTADYLLTTKNGSLVRDETVSIDDRGTTGTADFLFYRKSVIIGMTKPSIPDKVYDGTTTIYDASIPTKDWCDVPGDRDLIDVTVTPNSVSFPSSNAGTYNFVFKVGNTNTEDSKFCDFYFGTQDEYNVDGDSAVVDNPNEYTVTATISKRPITIEDIPDDLFSKIYDGTESISDDLCSEASKKLTLTNVINNEVTAKIRDAYYHTKDAGSEKYVTFTVELVGAKRTNYDLEDTGSYTATLTKHCGIIEKKEIGNGQLNVSNKEYDGTTDVIDYTYTPSGLLANESLDYTVESIRFENKNVGKQTVEASIVLNSTSNYIFKDGVSSITLSTSAQITAKPLSITSFDFSSVCTSALTYADNKYTLTDPSSFGFTKNILDGICNGDVVTATFTVTSYECSEVTDTDLTTKFTVMVNLGGADVNNYTLSPNPLTISGVNIHDCTGEPTEPTTPTTTTTTPVVPTVITILPLWFDPTTTTPLVPYDGDPSDAEWDDSHECDNPYTGALPAPEIHEIICGKDEFYLYLVIPDDSTWLYPYYRAIKSLSCTFSGSIDKENQSQFTLETTVDLYDTNTDCWNCVVVADYVDDSPVYYLLFKLNCTTFAVVGDSSTFAVARGDYQRAVSGTIICKYLSGVDGYTDSDSSGMRRVYFYPFFDITSDQITTTSTSNACEITINNLPNFDWACPTKIEVLDTSSQNVASQFFAAASVTINLLDLNCSTPYTFTVKYVTSDSYLCGDGVTISFTTLEGTTIMSDIIKTFSFLQYDPVIVSELAEQDDSILVTKQYITDAIKEHSGSMEFTYTVGESDTVTTSSTGYSADLVSGKVKITHPFNQYPVVQIINKTTGTLLNNVTISFGSESDGSDSDNYIEINFDTIPTVDTDFQVRFINCD